MVMKSYKTVGFGQKGQVLVAWYCSDSTPTKASAAVEGTDYILGSTYDATAAIATTSANAKGPNGCMSADTDAHNKCFNDDSISEFNKIRKNHKETEYATTRGTQAGKSAKELETWLLGYKGTCVSGKPTAFDATVGAKWPYIWTAAEDDDKKECFDYLYKPKETDLTSANIAKAMIASWYS